MLLFDIFMAKRVRPSCILCSDLHLSEFSLGTTTIKPRWFKRLVGGLNSCHIGEDRLLGRLLRIRLNCNGCSLFLVLISTQAIICV